MPHFLMTTLQIAVQIQGIDANMIKMCGVNVNDHPVLFFFFSFVLFFCLSGRGPGTTRIQSLRP